MLHPPPGCPELSWYNDLAHYAALSVIHSKGIPVNLKVILSVFVIENGYRVVFLPERFAFWCIVSHFPFLFFSFCRFNPISSWAVIKMLALFPAQTTRLRDLLRVASWQKYTRIVLGHQVLKLALVFGNLWIPVMVYNVVALWTERIPSWSWYIEFSNAARCATLST